MKEFYQKHANILHMSAFVICALAVSTTLIKEIKIAYYINPTDNVASVASTVANKPDTEEIKMELKDFNTLIVAAVKQHTEAPELHKKAISNSLTQLLKDRKALMLEKMKTDPQDILDNRLPADVKGKLSAEALGLLEKDVELEGKMSVIHIDDFEEHKNSKFEYGLIGKDKKFTYMNFAGETPGMQHGTKVRVKGVQIEDQLAIAGADGSSGSIQVLAAVTTSGADNTLFILGNFYDRKEEKLTPAQVKAAAFDIATSAKAYYLANSGGIVDLTGDAVGWFTMSDLSYKSCSPQDIYTRLNTLATQSGIDLSAYKHLVYVLPLNSCANALGSLGGNPSMAWVAVDHFAPLARSQSTLNHELGHNFTAHHANSYTCTDLTTPDYLSCIKSEYGDASDVMGVSQYSLYFNAPHQIATNWLSTSSVQTITASGRYSVAPIESGVGIRALKIAKPNTNEHYYVSYRQPIGFAETPAATSTLVKYSSGANIHVWNNNIYTQTYIISTNINDSNHVLSDNEAFGDPATGLKITQVSHSSSSVVVDIELGSYVDTIPPYTKLFTQSKLEIPNPFYLSHNVGSELVITASDDVGVTKTELYKDNVLQGTDTTAPYAISPNIATTPDGTKISVYAKAYDAAGNVGLSTTTTAIVDNTAPTITLLAPTSSNSEITGTTTIKFDMADNMSLRSASIFVDGKWIAGYRFSLITKTYSVTRSFNTADLVDGEHTLQIVVYDEALNPSYTDMLYFISKNSNTDTVSPLTNVGPPPYDNQMATGTIGVSVYASDNYQIDRVELWKDGKIFGSPVYYTNLLLSSTTTVFYWDTTKETEGNHTLQSVAYDKIGNKGTSPIKTINVQNGDYTAPTTPTNVQGTVISDTQIDLSWNASWDDFGIGGYYVYMNNKYVYDTKSPSTRTYSATNLTPGTTYSFSVAAYDTSNRQSALSSPITFTTTNNDLTPPYISFSSPTNNTVIKGKKDITVTATASDNSGISSLELFIDNNLVKTCSLSNTCSYLWLGKNITVGTHTLTARAVDNSTNKNTASTTIKVSK